MLSNEIGLRIAKMRENRGLSQYGLRDELEKAGLTVRRETITQWENGTRDLKTEYTVKLAEFFGVSCDYILRGVEAENIDFCRKTGLSQAAIDRLSSYDDKVFLKGNFMSLINDIICTTPPIVSTHYFLLNGSRMLIKFGYKMGKNNLSTWDEATESAFDQGYILLSANESIGYYTDKIGREIAEALLSKEL